MKCGFLFTICLSLWLTTSAVSAQPLQDREVSAFWTQFKAAVIGKNKKAVASMTKFPLSMPFGQRSVRSKADLLRRYGQIFDGETDAAKCSPKPYWKRILLEKITAFTAGLEKRSMTKTTNRFIIISKKQKPAGNLPDWIILMNKKEKACSRTSAKLFDFNHPLFSRLQFP